MISTAADCMVDIRIQAWAPHNQSLHQEIHFILFRADFWKSLWRKREVTEL